MYSEFSGNYVYLSRFTRLLQKFCKNQNLSQLIKQNFKLPF